MINLQDLFLYQVKKEKAPITTCLIKGFQFKGMVDGADGFTAILGSDNKQNPIYKNVISTIPPICAVKLNGRRSVLSFLSLNG